LPFLPPRTFTAFNSPESTSPGLISLPAFGAGSACCAWAEGAANVVARMAPKASRLANRRFVISIVSVCDC